MKKYLIGLLAIAIALSSAAFTRPTKPKAFTDYYWYNLDPSTGAITSGGTNTTSPTPTGTCNGSTHYCQVGLTIDQVTPEPGNPTFYDPNDPNYLSDGNVVKKP